MNQPTPAVPEPVPGNWAPPPPTPQPATPQPSSSQPARAANAAQPGSAPQPPEGESAATLLFDSREQAESAVDQSADRIKGSGAKGKMTDIARKVARREIRRAIVELLDVKLSGVVLRAWQSHGALLSAADRTAKGGGREVVLMADHTIKSTHSPRVELAIDGVEIGRITSHIALTMQIIGVNAVVQRGELVGIEGGSVVAAAKLSVEDVPIASRSRTVDALKVIQLSRPIRLAGAPAQPPGGPRTTSA
jgi:hypothetical protein